MTHEQTREKCTVVVVDDDQALRDSLKFSLEIDGFNVRVYADALKLLAEADFPENCCLVVDHYMPGMTGLQLIAALRERKIHVPAILVTSHPNASVKDQAAKAGVSIIEKPLFGTGLIDRIRIAAQGTGNDRHHWDDPCRT